MADDNFYILGDAGKVRIPNFPMPPLMNNHGNYIVSMGNVCRWMAQQAEDLGVEIFPGMACSEIIYAKDGSIKGVVAGEFGKAADGSHGPNYETGMELYGKYTFLSEGGLQSMPKMVAFLKLSMTRLSATFRTACIVKLVISKIRARTLRGSHRKVAMGRIIRICDGLSDCLRETWYHKKALRFLSDHGAF